jgi:hypothetical protein
MLIFIGVSFLIRLLGFTTPALWYDEAVSKYRSALPLDQYLADNSDFIGPNLWDIILRQFSHGPVWMLRMPALLCAMLALFIAWQIMDHLQFANPQRTTACVGLALLPGLLWMAQDARYYAAVAILFMAAIWYAITRHHIGLIACCGLLAYIHPVGPAYACAAFAIALICELSARTIIISSIITLFTWIPRYWIMLSRSDRGTFWPVAQTPAYIAYQTIQALFVDTLAWWIIPVAISMLLIIILLGISKLNSLSGRVMMAATIIPPVIILIEGALFSPVYFYRTIQPVGLSLCMLAGLVLAPQPGKPLLRVCMLTAAFVLLASFASYNPATRGGNIDLTAATIMDNWQPGDRIVYVSPMTAFPYSYYLSDYDSCLLDFDGPHHQLTRQFRQCKLSLLANSHGRIWLIWNTDFSLPPETASLLSSATAGSVPVATTSAWQFARVDIYLIAKSRP